MTAYVCSLLGLQQRQVGRITRPLHTREGNGKGDAKQVSESSLPPKCQIVELTGQEAVELVDAASDAKVNGAVTKVNDETALNGRVDLLGDLE